MYCLKDHNAVTPMSLKPAAPRSRVKHSTTEPLCSLNVLGVGDNLYVISNLNNNKYNSAESTQTPLSVASDLVLHCLLMSHKMDTRLKLTGHNYFTLSGVSV